MKVRAIHLNESFIELDAEKGVMEELSDYFSFHPAGYKFHPSFKKRRWDGKIRLVSDRNRRLYAGLQGLLREFCADQRYELEELGARPKKPEFTTEQARVYFNDLRPTRMTRDGRVSFSADDDQVEAFRQAIDRERITIISPTSSGKSLIMYACVRLLLDSGLARRILVIVPRTQLVDQMVNDFTDYSQLNGWPAVDRCHKIYSGQEKHRLPEGTQVVVTTWQSVYKMPLDWFLQFDGVFPDEAHGAKAKSLTQILECMTETRWRIGTTGTLPDTGVNKLVIAGLIGPPAKITTVKKLMKAGRVAQTTVVMLRFDYSDEDRKTVAQHTKNDKGQWVRMSYAEEYEFLCQHEARTRAIADLVTAQEGVNTAVFFSRVAHGKKLYDTFVERNLDRDTYYVDGGIHRTRRNENKRELEKKMGAVYFMSLGTSSTGDSINNLHRGVFASMVKGEILHLQSLGRLLRLDDDRLGAIVFDIVDDLQWKGKDNFALKHAAERMRHYVQEQHKVTSAEVRIQ